jgi:hypothetical protein
MEKAQKVDLVSEAHKVVKEISHIRTEFHGRKLSREYVSACIGLFNSSSRAIGTAIQAEKWKRSQNPKK